MSSPRALSAVVVGGGVSGLSSALALLEAAAPLGLLSLARVVVVADVFPGDAGLTSDGAGALWEMRGETGPQQALAAATFRRYERIVARAEAEAAVAVAAGSAGSADSSGTAGAGADDDGLARLPGPPASAAGVAVCDGLELFASRAPPRAFAAAGLVPRFRDASCEELAAAAARAGRPFGSGWRSASFVVDAPAYMLWLRARLEATGAVAFERRRVVSLADELARCGAADTLVNASGLGARELAADEAVQAARGETIRVSFPRESGLLREWIVANDDGGAGGGDGAALTYVLPRLTAGIAVVGGTYELGDEDTAPRAATSSAIWARATRLCPDLLDPRVERVAQWAGLRPCRDGGVKLGADGGDDRVIHNYGHGGEGHSLHWGCALRVAEAVLARHARLCAEDAAASAATSASSAAAVVASGELSPAWSGV